MAATEETVARRLWSRGNAPHYARERKPCYIHQASTELFTARSITFPKRSPLIKMKIITDIVNATIALAVRYQTTGKFRG